MARAQNSARGRFTKKAIVIPASGSLKFGSYSASTDLISANSSGIVIGGGIKLNNAGGAAQVTANSTALTLPGQLKVSGQALTISANTTTITLSGKLAVSGKSPTISANTTTFTLSGKLAVSGKTLTVEANTTTFTLSGKLAVSGKSPTIEANTTGHILSGGLALSGKSTKMITGNSTGALILPTVATLPNTRVLGGIALFRNSTGATLAVHTTGTTWEYCSLVGTAPAF